MYQLAKLYFGGDFYGNYFYCRWNLQQDNSSTGLHCYQFSQQAVAESGIEVMIHLSYFIRIFNILWILEIIP